MNFVIDKKGFKETTRSLICQSLMSQNNFSVVPKT